jgi:peptide/nickel transport system substrate-binding protein/oligopeptide transport system substrate-binding protein
MYITKRTPIRRGSLALGLLALLALILAACGSNGSSASQLDSAQKFIWPVIGAGSFNDLVLDPANVSDFYSSTVTNAVFSGLVTVDHDLNVIPDSSTWEISPDGRQYTFHLKPNLHFSDGSPLTSQDFAYSIDRSLDPNICVPVNGPSCVGSPLASTYLGDIKGATDRAAGTIPSLLNNGLLTPDAQTLVIKLDKPVAYFLEALTYPTSYPVEKSLVDKYGNDYNDHTDWTTHLAEGGGTGPFEIKSYGDGKTLTLVPNPYWHGAKITLKEVVRPFVLDPVDSYNSYRHGQYDYTDVPSQEYQSARDQGDFHEVGLLRTNYVGINQLAKPFDNLNVRQAFPWPSISNSLQTASSMAPPCPPTTSSQRACLALTPPLPRLVPIPASSPETATKPKPSSKATSPPANAMACWKSSSTTPRATQTASTPLRP